MHSYDVQEIVKFMTHRTGFKVLGWGFSHIAKINYKWNLKKPISTPIHIKCMCEKNAWL